MLKLLLKFSMGSWLSAAISFFTTPIITALIIPEEMGRASMYTLAFNLALQVTLLGIDQSFVRKFYSDNTADYQSRLLFHSLLLPFTFSFIICIGIFIFRKEVSLYLIDRQSDLFSYLLIGSIIVGIFERFAMLSIRMKKQAGRFSSLRVLFAVVNFLVVLGYCHWISRDFFSIIYGNLIGLGICTLIAMARLQSFWKNWQVDSNLLKSLLIYGLPFVPTFIAAWVFEGIDRMMLKGYSTFFQIGLFAAAYKIVALLSILQVAFSTFWAPVSFELYETNSDKARETYSNVFSYISVALFMAALGIILFKDVVILLFAKDYRDAASIMPFLLLIPVMYTMSEITVGGINFKHKTYWHLLIALACAVINFGLNYILVPKLEAKGAAISTGLAYVAFFYFRTIVSNSLFELKINFVRIHVTISVFVAVCFINTFYPVSALAYVSAVATLGLLLLLYKNELTVSLKGLASKAKSISIVTK